MGLVAEQGAGDNAAPLSVSELSSMLRRVVEDRFGFVRIRGELSGVKRAASGHLYCSLKDESGEYTLDNFSSQDAMAWETQGPVLDRTIEKLGTSDRGLVLYRRMLQEQIAAVQQGKEPLGVVRDPKKNEMIVIKVSEGQARMARKGMTSAAE